MNFDNDTPAILQTNNTNNAYNASNNGFEDEDLANTSQLNTGGYVPSSPDIEQPFGTPVHPVRNHLDHVLTNTNQTDSSRNSQTLTKSESMQNKLDTIKQWTLNTYKTTRQVVQEKLGKGTRTIDTELEPKIERIRETQLKYTNILQLVKTLTGHFSNLIETQKILADTLYDMTTKNPELQKEFATNAETQKVVAKNGEILIVALKFFAAGLNTIITKSIEDTITTIKKYEAARVEYDAYRTDFETVANAPVDGSSVWKRDEVEKKFLNHKEKYEKLRGDVQIKMKFLDENRVKVMSKHLILLNNAVSAFFTGNSANLDTSQAVSTPKTSFLEH